MVHFVFEHKVHLKLVTPCFHCLLVGVLAGLNRLEGYQQNLTGGWGRGKERIHKTCFRSLVEGQSSGLYSARSRSNKV